MKPSVKDKFEMFMKLNYPDVTYTPFTKVRDKMLLKHPRHGHVERTPESILKSSSMNFNGTRVHALSLVGGEIKEKIYLDIQENLGVKLETVTLGDIEFVKAGNLIIDILVVVVQHHLTNHNRWLLVHESPYKYFGIQSFYWEERRAIYMAKLQHLLGMDERVYARKTKIVELTRAEAAPFIADNHLEGFGVAYSNARFFGLTHNDELLMVASVGRQFQQGTKTYVTKVHRMCTKKGYTVVGGVSKLIRYMNTIYPEGVKYLITLTTGGSSITLSDSWRLTNCRYYWVNPRTLEYLHRNQTQRSQLERRFGVPLYPIDTEASYMEARGFCKVYDCGIAELIVKDS